MTETAERIYVPESGQSLRVLEIGGGGTPAIKSGGSLFENNNVWFLEADIPTDDMRSDIKFHGLPKDHSFVYANAAHLEMRDESFDYVLMRSVFGQFNGSAGDISNLDDIRTWGLKEAFRTLKPGGHIVIAEENTPWDNDYVESYLKDTGFEPVAYDHISDIFDRDNPKKSWQDLRKVFYGSSKVHQDNAYIIIAQKPLHPDEPSYPYKTGVADVWKLPPRKPRVTNTLTTWHIPGRRSLPNWMEGELIEQRTYKWGKPFEKPSILKPRKVPEGVIYWG